MPRPTDRADLLRILPPAVVAAHFTACVGGLAIDWLIVHVVALGLLAASALPRLIRPPVDRLPMAWLLPALAWLLWLALNGPAHPPAPDLRFSRVAVDAAMCLAAVLVMGGPFERGLVALGQGVVAALVLAMAGSAVLRYPDLGLGMMNHLLAFTVPVGVAWAVWAWPEATRRQRWLFLVLLAAVAVWMLFAIADAPRRGGLVALLAGCLAPWAWARARRHPRLALLAVSMLAVGAFGLGAWAASQADGSQFRTQRIGIWSASWEGVAAWWPWGGGSWSSLRLSDLPADAARAVSSGNATFDHPHNELLAVAQDQGLPGLLVLLAVVLMLLVPALRLDRSRMQDACLALLAATLVFLMVENAYSLPACRIMLGLSLGLLGAAVLDGGHGGRMAGRRLTAGLVLAGAMAAAWAAWQEAPAALLPRQAPATSLMRPMEQTCLPQVADQLLDMAYRPEVLDLEGIDELTSLALRRFGTAPSLVRWRYRAVCAAAAAATAPIPGWPMPVQGSQVLVDECIDLAQHVLHADPFLIPPYRCLAGLRPDAPQVRDPRLVRRARWLFGGARLPDPSVLEVRTLDGQADAWAVLLARLDRGAWDESCHAACDRLLRAASACQGVVRLAQAVIAVDPGRASAWEARYPVLLRHAPPVQAGDPR